MNISVITPTYNTPPEILARTWASLKRQSYKNWEWVIWDDSTKPETWAQIWGFCADERYTVKAHRSLTHSGSIGQVKRQAFMVAEGDVLLELDHDDELTPDALQLVADAFANKPVGFAYSDWCEINELGESTRYPEGWAFGYGDHYWDHEHNVWVMKAPPINTMTLSHIVSAPNHLRAWRASTYRGIGGHDPLLEVADDYDLVVRTLLHTDYTHLPAMLYKQHISTKTAQRQKNALIQSTVQRLSAQYKEQILAKFGNGPYYDPNS